ncbi:hypothetical protein ACN47E_010149 [Coniothyrium glycines]
MLSSSWAIYRKTFATPRERLEAHQLGDKITVGIREDIMVSPHRSRRPTSSDSGYSTTSERLNPSPKEHTRTHDSQRSPISTSKSQKQIIDHEVPLSSVAKRTDLTSSIGTQLSEIQIAELTSSQRDELALLVSERGVVFLRDQHLSQADQSAISSHYGSTYGKHIIERTSDGLKLKSSPTDHGERFTYSTGRENEWSSDRSFEASPPSYSIITAREAIGDTIWVSQYGLYDSLSPYMRGFFDSLTIFQTSERQFGTIVDLRGMPSDRSPIETQHPAVRTHPVTGIKALNVTPDSATRFTELSKKESNKVLELLKDHLQSADEHTVRFHWEAGSVAIWDNRCTAHKHLLNSKDALTKVTETASIGEKPYFDPRSESRSDKQDRLIRDEQERLRRTEETKRRYNNTPLRRILTSQAIGEQYASTVKSSVNSAPKFSPTHESTSHEQSTTEDPIEVAFGKTKPESTQSSTSKLGRTTRVQVSSKGSPLRRIIQRQASADVRVQ